MILVELPFLFVHHWPSVCSSYFYKCNMSQENSRRKFLLGTNIHWLNWLEFGGQKWKRGQSLCDLLNTIFCHNSCLWGFKIELVCSDTHIWNVIVPQPHWICWYWASADFCCTNWPSCQSVITHITWVFEKWMKTAIRLVCGGGIQAQSSNSVF